jgi:hypothetical protein
MFLITWMFDKIGYMPKPSVRITFPFPVAQKAPTVAKKVTKKAVKIPKATTRKTPKK